MEVEHTAIPDGLLERLSRKNLRYTSPEFFYHCVWLWGDTYCGVFGDGPNASYEWFIWEKKTGIAGYENLETSDCGYGAISIALRDVLLRMEPVDPR